MNERTELNTSRLIVAGSPQIHDALSTTKLNWLVAAGVAPAALWGFIQFGLPAVTVVLAGVGAAALTEAVLPKRVGSVRDGNAILIGLLMSLMFPPAAPWYLAAVSAVFAVGIVKWAFGGLGHAILNPAVAGRVLAQVLAPQEMSRYAIPLALGGGEFEHGATAVMAVRSAAGSVEPLQRLQELGYPRSVLDQAVTAWLNEHLFEPVGVVLPSGYVDPFIGLAPGGIGETSALLLLVASAVLLGRRVISWQVPLAFFAGFAAAIAVWGSVAFGGVALRGDVLFHSLHGGVLFLMFFCATDNTGAPATGNGMVLYGLAAGVLAAVLRLFGLYAEGLAVAVLVVSFFVPLINHVTKPARFGFSRRRRKPLLYKPRG